MNKQLSLIKITNFIHGGKLVVNAINILDIQNYESGLGEKTELTTLIR